MPTNQNATEKDFRNPFEGKANESLNGAIDELKEITVKLEKEAFEAAGDIVTKWTRESLAQAYSIQNVIVFSQRCQWYIADAVQTKISDDLKETQDRLVILRKCASQNRIASGALVELDTSINQYKTLFPDNRPHVALRLGATGGTVGGAISLSQFFFPDNVALGQIITGIVALACVPLFLVIPKARKKKSILAGKSETDGAPYHKIAEEKISGLMGMNAASKELERPQIIREVSIKDYGYRP